MKARIYFSIASLVFALGCEKKPQEQPTTEPSAEISAPSMPATPDPAAPVPLAIEDPDIEVPEDFANDAAEAVTEQNLDSELAALEKEINSDT